MSRFPVAFRLPAFRFSVIRFPPGIGPSLRSAYRTEQPGPRRGYRVPHARVTTGVGASSTPRTAVLFPAERSPQPAPAASQRPVLAPRYQHPISGAPHYEASTEVYALHPSGLSPRLWPPDGTGALGLFPELRTPPARSRTTHVGAGTGHEHGPGTTLSTSAEPPITCSLVSVRPRVAGPVLGLLTRAPPLAPATHLFFFFFFFFHRLF